MMFCSGFRWAAAEQPAPLEVPVLWWTHCTIIHWNQFGPFWAHNCMMWGIARGLGKDGCLSKLLLCSVVSYQVTAGSHSAVSEAPLAYLIYTQGDTQLTNTENKAGHGPLLLPALASLMASGASSVLWVLPTTSWIRGPVYSHMVELSLVNSGIKLEDRGK